MGVTGAGGFSESAWTARGQQGKMGLGFHSFIRALVLALTCRRKTLRRIGFYFFILPIFSLLFLIVLLGQWVDDFLFQGYRLQQVHTPVFIIATPRSGTTLLHRALCLDEDQFTYFRTYQTLLPSIFLYKLAQGASGLDRRLGRFLTRLVQTIDDRVFAGWEEIHPTGFAEAEEDEGLFIYTLYTPAVYLLFPVMEQMPAFTFSDFLPPKLRQRLLIYYKGCLQRFLFTYGNGRMLLSKNVLSIGRLRSLLDAFPDARVISIVRHPYQAIPSLLSLFYVVWQNHSPEIRKDSPETKALARMGMDYYRYLFLITRRLPTSQFLSVQYDDLVSDLQGVVEDIYSHFQLPLAQEFRFRLGQLAAEGKNYQSTHEYSLEEYGLEKEVIFSALSDVFKAYGFSK